MTNVNTIDNPTTTGTASEVTQELTCTANELTTYTATFENEAFEAIRRKKYGNEVKCFNDVDALANGMVNMHFSGYGLFDIFDAYRSITKKDVEDVIKSSFDESKCILSVIK